MVKKKLKKFFGKTLRLRAGQVGMASRTLIILAVVILVMAVIVYVVTRVIVNQRAKPAETTEEPKPVYDITIGDTRIFVESARDLGNIMYGKASRFPTQQPNITTTDRFLIVSVAAQNKGKVNIPQYMWDLGNVVDGEGRNFVPISDKAYSWLPFPDQCGAILKPEFEPTPCTRIYEVSKVSDTFKLQVLVIPPDSSKPKMEFLDLQVR